MPMHMGIKTFPVENTCSNIFFRIGIDPKYRPHNYDLHCLGKENRYCYSFHGKEVTHNVSTNACNQNIQQHMNKQTMEKFIIIICFVQIQNGSIYYDLEGIEPQSEIYATRQPTMLPFPAQFCVPMNPYPHSRGGGYYN